MLTLLLHFAMMYAASVPGPLVASLGRAPSGGGPCSGITGTYKDCFTGLDNPLANPPWTTSGCGAGYATVRATGTSAIPGTALSTGCALYTGGAFGGDQTARFLMNTTGFAGVSGPCIHAATSGNMYCYLINLQQIWVLTSGHGVSAVVSGCPSTSGGDTHIWRISNVGNTLTCADETTGGTASGTDSTYTGSGGVAGFLIDESGGGTGTQAVTKFGAS